MGVLGECFKVTGRDKQWLRLCLCGKAVVTAIVWVGGGMEQFSHDPCMSIE